MADVGGLSEIFVVAPEPPGCPPAELGGIDGGFTGCIGCWGGDCASHWFLHMLSEHNTIPLGHSQALLALL